MDIKTFEILDSTNTYAKKIAHTITEDTVILAHQQTNGYGRHGNVWESPEGNLFTTFIVSLNYEFFHVSLLSSVFLGKALQYFNRNVQFKWPNDMYINDAKLGGVLIESIDDKYVIGMGVNVVCAPAIEEYRTTFLGHNIHKIDVLEKIIENFQMFKDYSFIELRDIWMNNCSHLNKHIFLKPYGEGIFKGIDNSFSPVFL